MGKLLKEVFAALPKDPDAQLEVAQQITQFAVSGRVKKLEEETSSLRSKVAEKDAVIGSLQSRVIGAETTLAETTAKLEIAMEGQAKLIKDKDVLSGQVKKLMCQVGQLDDFKKALMKSLEASAECGDSGDEKAPCPPDPPSGSPVPKPTPIPSKRKNPGAFSCRKSICPDCPETPPPPPPAIDKAVGPDEEQRASPMPPSAMQIFQRAVGPLTPRTPRDISSSPAKSPKFDGKEFFRQARNRLSYEQFSEFLTQIKDLNAHRQTREETRKKSSEIFGPDNHDLNEKFASLLTRYVTPPLPEPPAKPGSQPGLKPCSA